MYSLNLDVSPIVKLSGDLTVILNLFPFNSYIPLTSENTTVSPSFKPCFF
jgi:hypothetical protein